MSQMQLLLQIHQKSSTTSHSSKQVKKKEKTINRLSLIRNVQNLIKKNQNKYSTILKQNPQFSMSLYKPSASLLPQKLSAINEEILLKQLDNLMDDECQLDKELNKINFENQQIEKIREVETQNNMDHYLFLRSIWKKETVDSPHNEDRLQNLNKKIGFIKGHIKTLISKQKEEVSPQMKKMIIESDQYGKLKEKYERMLMSQEDQKMLFDAQIKRKQQKSNTKIESLQKENESMIQKYFEERQKNRKLQNQIIHLNMKLQNNEKIIMDKEKQITKLNRERKYIYKNQEEFSLILVSKNVCQHKTIPITKSINQIHEYLTSSLNNTEQQEKETYEFTNKFSEKISELELDSIKMKRLYHTKVEKENPRKVRHIKGINDLKSVDMKRPKFIRSNACLDDSMTKLPRDESSKRN